MSKRLPKREAISLARKAAQSITLLENVAEIALNVRFSTALAATFPRATEAASDALRAKIVSAAVAMWETETKNPHLWCSADWRESCRETGEAINRGETFHKIGCVFVSIDGEEVLV